MPNVPVFYDKRGTILVDSAGFTFYEYLVFAIRAYWKKGRASHAIRRHLFNPEMIF
ncbi:hypothetical protein M408DRAFT_331706 [Serendipita vermifera MAFF 305830]|uniref:Uncharacterized protein n=1 Tax=Serendipita vermifera MAFF 305830 TaxID=933852 RepID=A0A0C3AZG2_SERVB|nr:hypothetical protein M408DRAFT_331706 [Serendipita vermifera MAFF 305830]